MFYFTDFVLCVLACLLQTGLSQCGCKQISYGSSGSSSCASYGGMGTGQVEASGDIDASGQTAVVGSVPVLGSVGFGGCAPVCGSVSINGQCDCDSQSEETFSASVASRTDLFGKDNAAAAAMRNRDLTSGLLGQRNCPQTTPIGQCSPSSIALSLPRASVSSTSSLSLNEPTGILSALSVNAPSIVVSAPLISPASINSLTLNSPSTASYGPPLPQKSGGSKIAYGPSGLAIEEYSVSAPSISKSSGSAGSSSSSSITPSFSVSKSSGSAGLFTSSSYGASYGGVGTGQVGVSGDFVASGQTVVVGSVPVRGSVDFSGCTPTFGSVCISGQCECKCD